MALRSQQARQIRMRLHVRMVLWTVLFTCVFAAGCAVFECNFTPGIAEAFASVGRWQVLDQQAYDEFSRTVDLSDWQVIVEKVDPAEATDAAADAAAATATDVAGAVRVTMKRIFDQMDDVPGGDAGRTVPAEATASAADATEDVDAADADIYVYKVRDLSLYNRVRPLKYAFAVLLYVLGVFAIALFAINRSVRYFDQLAGALSDLVAGRDAVEALPRELSLAAGELAAVKARSEAEERAAQAAESRKNELVAYLAHDIKTPLTSVLGYLDLLANAEGLPAATQQRYAVVAHEKAERLDGLVDEFFEITRYNLSAIPIEREQVNARLFLEQLADEFFPEAQRRGLRLDVECPADAQLYIDPDKMARAVSNVVRNAVAYANADTAIRLSLGPATDAGWKLNVQNQGREISEAHLQSIFEKFYRADEARATGKGGAGLGLAIAKEIVVAHGGRIFAESRDGATTFTLLLP